MAEQVTVIYAGTNGFVDDYPVAVLGRYESEMMSFIKSRKKEILDAIRTSGKLDETTEKQLLRPGDPPAPENRLSTSA